MKLQQAGHRPGGYDETPPPALRVPDLTSVPGTQAGEAVQMLKLVQAQAAQAASAAAARADRAAAELLQEVEQAGQATQRSKQKSAAKKARQKQRKQVPGCSQLACMRAARRPAACMSRQSNMCCRALFSLPAQTTAGGTRLCVPKVFSEAGSEGAHAERGSMQVPNVQAQSALGK